MWQINQKHLGDGFGLLNQYCTTTASPDFPDLLCLSRASSKSLHFGFRFFSPLTSLVCKSSLSAEVQWQNKLQYIWKINANMQMEFWEHHSRVTWDQLITSQEVCRGTDFCHLISSLCCNEANVLGVHWVHCYITSRGGYRCNSA